LKTVWKRKYTLVVFSSDNGPWLNYDHAAEIPEDFRRKELITKADTAYQGVRWKRKTASGVVYN
jgi:hypothetical protein